MIRALKLEYLKFKAYRPFQIILLLYVAAYFAIGLSVNWFVDWLLSQAGEGSEFFKVGLPVFDFVDIWQNLAYVVFLFKVILAFVVIISICLEHSNKTIRQNFIDGLSRREYLLSKVNLILFLTIISGLLLFILGLILGFLYSPVKSLPFVVMNLEFVLAHMYEVFCYLTFAIFLATLIRRTGFTIVLFTLYTIAIEPIVTSIMKFEYELPVWFFPGVSVNNIVRVPFPKYIFKEVQDYVALQDIIVAGGWAALFLFLTYRLTLTRDV